MESSESNFKKILKVGIPLILFLVLTFKFRELMGNEDFTAFFRWWAALLLAGLGFMPLTMSMFKKFRDKGWLFSKALGLAIGGWLVWFLSSFKLLKFTDLNIYLTVGACIVANLVFAVIAVQRDKKFNADKTGKDCRYTFGKFSFDTVFSITMSELVFYAAFLTWTYLRCFRPDILGNTEKFMDYGFMTSIDRAEYMPAEDIWLSGNAINYYYLGQYMAVFVKRLSGVSIKDSYNLALMMVGGFAAAMPYSLINQVTSDFVKRSTVNTRQGKMRLEEVPEKWYTQLVGLFAGISVCYAGNMHYTIIKHLAMNIPWLKKLLSIERDRYWFPDATRYIGYTPDTEDKTIHEFPSYSFVLGDLHAHVVNIMFVLSVMAVLYTIFQVRRARMDAYRNEGFGSIKGYDIKSAADRKELLLTEILTPQIFVLGFFIGLFHMTNFWDFPIYFVVSGAIILFSNAVICKFRYVTLILTAAHAVVILVVSAIVSLPFTLSFDQISTGIAISLNHTPIYQLFVLWGLPITVVITFLVAMIKKLNKSLGKRFKKASDKKKKNPNREPISDFCDNHPGFDWLYRMINSLEITDLFILTIGLCAIGLVLMPELVYVKDIYSGSYKRANTMFKLTYQAFIMFGMCMPYIIARFLRFADHKRQIVFGGITLFLLITTFGYYFDATESWFGKYMDHENYKGLDCTAFVKDYYPEDERAAEWINENISGPVRILEAAGYSYTYYGRIAVLTGSTTPIGWETHEWLWRSSANFAKPEIITERQKDVKALYTSESKEEVEALIEKYDLDYIIVGLAERYDGMRKGEANEEGFVRNTADNYWYKTQEVNDDLIRSLGEIVYQDKDENGSVFRSDGTYMTYIVKVKK